MCVDICVAMWYACVTSLQCIGNSSTKVMYYIRISTTDMHVCTCVHISGRFRGGAKGATAPPPS